MKRKNKALRIFDSLPFRFQGYTMGTIFAFVFMLYEKLGKIILSFDIVMLNYVYAIMYLILILSVVLFSYEWIFEK